MPSRARWATSTPSTSLRAAIRTDLGRDAERNADAQVRSALISELVTANNVPAPHSLVHRWLHAYAHQFGVPHEHEPGGALEKFEAQFHDIAEAQVRRDLVSTRWWSQEKLRATEAEIDERVGAPRGGAQHPGRRALRPAPEGRAG